LSSSMRRGGIREVVDGCSDVSGTLSFLCLADVSGTVECQRSRVNWDTAQ
jgi:hypothetical protein